MKVSLTTPEAPKTKLDKAAGELSAEHRAAEERLKSVEARDLAADAKAAAKKDAFKLHEIFKPGRWFRPRESYAEAFERLTKAKEEDYAKAVERLQLLTPIVTPF